jgi:hypothetical protein
MSTHRSYFEKQATIIKGNNTNNSRNPIIEMVYGGSTEPESTTYSRYIFKVDIDSLVDKVTREELMVPTLKSHKLHIKNVISFAKDLTGGDLYGMKRGNGVEVILYALTEDFDEGTGFDYLYTQSTIFTDANAPYTFPNWKYRKMNQEWGTEGTFSDLPATIIASQKIEEGNEDLEFDVTTFMNCVLLGDQEYHGFGIAFIKEVEEAPIEQQHVITFFSKYTSTFYEPYLETISEAIIDEDRSTFYLDEDNSLYLVSNRDIDGVDQVDIWDHDEEHIMSIPSEQIEKVKRNVYKITLNIPDESYPDQVIFRDVWFYNYKGKQKCHEQSFTLVERDLFEVDNYNSMEHWFGFSGIRHNEVINTSVGAKRVNINAKRLFGRSVVNQPNIDGLEYRVYTLQGKEQIDVVPYTKVNKVGTAYFFDLDFKWFIPQQYILEVRIMHNGFEQRSKQNIKFRVVS